TILSKASAICQRLADQQTGDCKSAYFDFACFSLGFLGNAIDGARKIVDIANGKLKDIAVDTAFFLVDQVATTIQAYANQTPAPSTGSSVLMSNQIVSLQSEEAIVTGEDQAIVTADDIQQLLSQLIAEANAQANKTEGLSGLQTAQDSTNSASN